MQEEQLAVLESAFAKKLADVREQEIAQCLEAKRLKDQWTAKINKGLGVEIAATRARLRSAATELKDELATQALAAQEKEEALSAVLDNTLRALTEVRQRKVDRIAAEADAGANASAAEGDELNRRGRAGGN